MPRPTPLFDAWLQRFTKAVKKHGATTRAAEALAKHLGITAPGARATINRILGGAEPRAEILLFLSRWMERP